VRERGIAGAGAGGGREEAGGEKRGRRDEGGGGGGEERGRRAGSCNFQGTRNLILSCVDCDLVIVHFSQVLSTLFVQLPNWQMIAKSIPFCSSVDSMRLKSGSWREKSRSTHPLSLPTPQGFVSGELERLERASCQRKSTPPRRSKKASEIAATGERTETW